MNKIISMQSQVANEVFKCMQGSTAHAIPRMANFEEKKCVRIFWRIMWLFAISLFLTHFYMLLSTFLAQPVSTSINYHTLQFQFPDVTLCNFSPFSFLLIERKHNLNEFLNTLPAEKEAVDNLTAPFKLHSENLIISCDYNGNQCSHTEFLDLEDTDYTSCFTFRPKVREIENSGPDYGLKLVVFVDNRHNHPLPPHNIEICHRKEMAGIQVTIHNEGTHPHSALNGFQIGPGVFARVALSYVEPALIPRPDGNSPPCIEGADPVVKHCNLHTGKVETFTYYFK